MLYTFVNGTKKYIIKPQRVKFKIIPTPSDATVTITASGYTQNGNYISVAPGTSVSWSVSKSGYASQSGTQTVNSTANLSVTLQAVTYYTFTISPTPSDAIVTLTASGYTQSGNSIAVPDGTSVSWSVSKYGYITQSGTQTVTSNYTKSVSLTEVVKATYVMSSFRSGGENNLVLYSDGKLYGCGLNTYGELGQGTTSNVTTWTLLASDVKSMSSSSATVWYITNSDVLYGAGMNTSGQQGNGTAGSTTHVTTFTQRATNVKKVVATPNTTWYLTNDGLLYGCGNNANGQQGNGTSSASGNVTTFTQRASNVKDVSATESVTTYIDNNDDLYTCGSNTYGQQGTGSTTSAVTSFGLRASNVKSVKPVSNNIWYLTNDSNLYSAGRNNYCQQGVSSTSNVTSFTQRASNVKEYMHDGSTTWYLDNNDNLYSSGLNTSGQQGTGDTTNTSSFAVRISNVKEFRPVYNETCVLDNNGTMYMSGTGGDGLHGYGDTTGSSSFVSTATNVTTIFPDLNPDYTLTKSLLFRKNDFKLYGCGDNSCGQQGDGTTTDVYTYTLKNIR